MPVIAAIARSSGATLRFQERLSVSVLAVVVTPSTMNLATNYAPAPQLNQRERLRYPAYGSTILGLIWEPMNAK